MPKPWSISPAHLSKVFRTHHLHGLSSAEARRRSGQYGPNELNINARVANIEIFFHQLTNPVVLILLLAAGLAALEHEYGDLIAILLVVVVNTLIGYYQEAKAEATMAKLRRILSPQARVIRDSIEQKIRAALLVPGDVILLEAGDSVPADARLIQARNLRVNQAALTGESTPAHKLEGLLSPGTALINRTNMVYLSTLVVSGTGVAIVTGTGLATELGQIAQEVASVNNQPEQLTKKVSQLGTFLLWGALGLATVVLLVGLYQGISILTMAKITISLLVSLVPEGLPVAMTVALSVGLLRVFQHRAVIRKLTAAETLGSTTVICVDKTGTVTAGEIMVERLFVAGQEFTVDGQGFDLSGHFYTPTGQRTDPTKLPAARLLLELTSLCTMSTISQDDLLKDKVKQLTDPTETALAVVAAKAGFYAFKEERTHPELLEVPFDQELRYSTSVHRFDTQERFITKGAPEKVLKLCRQQLGSDGKIRPLPLQSHAKLEEQANHYAAAGYRVVALAYHDRGLKEPVGQLRLNNLIFVGFLAMVDPIRSETRVAIQEAQAAGLRVIMISGDHLLTAKAIGQKIGLVNGSYRVIHASELSGHPLKEVGVIARATPSQKLSIVNQLQLEGEVVAMTGDGVNDAPALKEADIGIAMGRTGTDAAIEAADMVLLNDNLQTIITAIQEGRLIWDNLKKVIYYLVSTSLAEALILIIALMWALPLPLVAIQILWLNLVTDGVTSLALVFERPDNSLMSGQSAGPRNQALIDKAMVRRMLLASGVMTLGTFFLFSHFTRDINLARSVALTTMVFFNLFNLFNSRSATASALTIKFTHNRTLFGLFGIALGLQLLALYHPAFNHFLHTVPLSFNTLIICALVAISIVVADEIRKFTLVSLHRWAKSQSFNKEVYTKAHELPT